MYAARKVVIEYADISPVIISIEDAIENQSFFPEEHSIETGDMSTARLEADCHVKGSGRVGGQGNIARSWQRRCISLPLKTHTFLFTISRALLPRDELHNRSSYRCWLLGNLFFDSKSHQNSEFLRRSMRATSQQGHGEVQEDGWRIWGQGDEKCVHSRYCRARCSYSAKVASSLW